MSDRFFFLVSGYQNMKDSRHRKCRELQNFKQNEYFLFCMNNIVEMISGKFYWYSRKSHIRVEIKVGKKIEFEKARATVSFHFSFSRDFNFPTSNFFLSFACHGVWSGMFNIDRTKNEKFSRLIFSFPPLTLFFLLPALPRLGEWTKTSSFATANNSTNTTSVEQVKEWLRVAITIQHLLNTRSKFTE